MSSKKLVSILMALLLLFQVAAVAGAENQKGLEAGTYHSEQRGHNGMINFEITLNQDGIEKIEVVESAETPGVSDKALYKDYPNNIIENQSLEVDMITGATITSMAVKRAVEDAIVQAGGDVENFKKEVETLVPETEKTADVVIVGAGGAGLAAAVAASQGGASVVLVEKAGYVGGNTMVSGGIYNAPDQKLQEKLEMTKGSINMIEEAVSEEPVNDEHKELMEIVKAQLDEYKASGKTGLFDTKEWFALQTWNGGDKVGDLNHVKTLTYQSYDAMEWIHSLGWEYTDMVNAGPGALYPRTHNSLDPLGTGIINAYVKTLEENDKVEIIYNTEVTKLLTEGEKVVGAEGKDKDGNVYTFNANQGVVLSTGGFAGNIEMIQEYNTSGKWPDLSKTKSTNLPAMKGDGITLAKEVGAALKDMDQIQLLYACDPKTGIATHGLLALNGMGSVIYVNQEGKRFVREDGRRDEISLGIIEQTGGVAYEIASAESGADLEKTIDLGGTAVKDLIEGNTVFYGDTLEEACEKAGLPVDAVKETVAEYNKLVEDQVEKDEFGKAIFANKLENGPWFVTPRAPSVHHTMGGVSINENCQVLNEQGEVIEGLFAAGEIVGGIHGANRLGGNAIVDTVVFGKIAGEQVVK
ncbi:MAG: flavocytochrome c [Clostridiales bacterium]|nr:flavocytochrome c [Clostridiales bacterium]